MGTYKQVEKIKDDTQNGKINSKLKIWLIIKWKINLQNIQATHTAQWQKNNNPIKSGQKT